MRLVFSYNMFVFFNARRWLALEDVLGVLMAGYLLSGLDFVQFVRRRLRFPCVGAHEAFVSVHNSIRGAFTG